MIQENLDFLIEDLVMTGSNGTPVVVLVEDYREQKNLADGIIEKAREFGVDVECLRGFDVTTKQLPSLESLRNQAAVLLIDAGQAGDFGPWLDAIREALPQLVRFLIVLIFKNDFPQFAKKSPAFTSWTKVTEIEKPAAENRSDPRGSVDKVAGKILKRGTRTVACARGMRETGPQGSGMA